MEAGQNRLMRLEARIGSTVLPIVGTNASKATGVHRVQAVQAS